MSHVAIVARALDIPVVGRAPDVRARIEAGDSIVVDGDNAQVLVRPAEGHPADRLCRDRRARRAAAQVCRPARPAVGDPRSSARLLAHERRPVDRHAASRRQRRRRRRTLSHRDSVHGAVGVSRVSTPKLGSTVACSTWPTAGR